MRANLPDNELQRLEALNLYKILDTPPEQIYDDLTLIASTICQTPMSFIGFIDKDRQWFKSDFGLETKETSRDLSFCTHTILNRKTLIINDVTTDERFFDNPLVTGKAGIRFYAATPLINKDGFVLGTLSVIDTVPRQLTDKQIKSLEALGRQVMENIENRLKNNNLKIEIEKLTKELELEKNKLITLLTNAPAVIGIWKGAEHIFEFANSNYLKIIGNRDVIGKSVREVLPEVEGQGFFEALDSVYKTGKPFIGKEVYSTIDIKNDGQLEDVYWDFVYQPIIDENNNVSGIIDFAYDITEQVVARHKLEKLNIKLLESEARYKSLAESLEIKVRERTAELILANKEIEIQRNKLNDLFMNAPAGICLLEGPEHVYTFINPVYSQLTGNRNILNKPIREAVPEIEGQGFFELLDNVYKTGETFIGNEMPGQLANNPDGSLVQMYFNFVFQPMFDSNNQVTGISMFAFDVNEQVKARHRVEKLNNDLNRSNEELQNFAYVASHDLQAPLRTITSYSQLLEKKYKDKLDSDANDFIELIQQGSRRMTNLIDDILNYSKIARQEIITDVTDLNEIIENIKANLITSLEEKNVLINCSNLPVLRIERVHMLQVFQNLISNAIKYSRKDVTPVINISSQKKNNEWIFSVSDNGIGINKKYFKKIFEMFQRLHGSDEFEGTGIGLANVQKIVELYGGKIWVESEENKGSQFYFTLPDIK